MSELMLDRASVGEALDVFSSFLLRHNTTTVVQRAEALAWAERYLALAPGDPQAQRLVAELRARR